MNRRHTKNHPTWGVGPGRGSKNISFFSVGSSMLHPSWNHLENLSIFALPLSVFLESEISRIRGNSGTAERMHILEGPWSPPLLLTSWVTCSGSLGKLLITEALWTVPPWSVRQRRWWHLHQALVGIRVKWWYGASSTILNNCVSPCPPTPTAPSH